MSRFCLMRVWAAVCLLSTRGRAECGGPSPQTPNDQKGTIKGRRSKGFMVHGCVKTKHGLCETAGWPRKRDGPSRPLTYLRFVSCTPTTIPIAPATTAVSR